MPTLDFKYPAEKLSTARSALLLPPDGKDADAIALAYFEFTLGVSHVDLSKIEDECPKQWIATVKKIMNTDNVEDPHKIGTVLVRARQLRYNKKREFAKAIDELASWFNTELWFRSGQNGK